MNFVKLVSLFAFVTLAILSLGFASAQSTVLDFTPTSVSQTIIAGQSATINFNLRYTGSSNPASLTWTSAIGVGTITTPTVNSIGPNQTIALSSTISIPSNAASGTISAVINASVSGGVPESLPITITIIQPQQSNLTIAVSGSQPFNTNQNATLTVTNTGNTALSVLMSETSTPLFGVTFSPQSFTLSGSQSSQSVQAVLNALSNLKFGINTVTVRATAGSQSTAANFQVKKTFCSAGEILNSNLTISSIEWSNNGEGEDNNWELLDDIELDVEVKNNNNDDDVDVVVELGLYDSSGSNVADDLVFLEDSDSEDEQIEINIKDDDEETVTFKFKVPADFDAGNYKLAIKVFDDDIGQSKSCRDSLAGDLDNTFFQSIDVEQTSDEGRFIAIDEVSLDSQLTCGQSVSGQFTVFNVGEDDQDRVRITIRNQELGINEVREITSDLDQGDDETLDFTVNIPRTAENGNYVLEFLTEYDYKNGVYRQDSDESSDYPIEVIGCSENLGGNTGGLTDLEITAELDSEARAGKELVVVATIRNTGDEDATYSLSARGYSTWAELVDISDGTISVDAGESKDVTFTLLVNKDATGTQEFDIQVASGGRVQIQNVEVEMSNGLSSNLFSIGNPILWIIGIVNIILIVLIIVVAVKLSRK